MRGQGAQLECRSSGIHATAKDVPRMWQRLPQNPLLFAFRDNA